MKTKKKRALKGPRKAKRRRNGTGTVSPDATREYRATVMSEAAVLVRGMVEALGGPEEGMSVPPLEITCIDVRGRRAPVAFVLGAALEIIAENPERFEKLREVAKEIVLEDEGPTPERANAWIDRGAMTMGRGASNTLLFVSAGTNPPARREEET